MSLRGKTGARAVRERLLRACLLLLIVASPQGDAMTQEGGRPTIERIVIDGNQRISDEAVIHLMTVKPGDAYDEALLREEFKRIWARGLFEDLSIEARDVEGGKAIIVHVREKPVVNSLKYDESKIAGETQIEDALRTRGAQVSIGEPVDYTVLKKAEEAIKTLLHQKGFLDAEVRAETRDTGNGNVEVSFKIDEGAKTRIRKIDFVGNTVFSERRLKKALKNTKEKGWFTRLRQKDVYHPLKLDTDLREIETLYSNAGYIDADLPPARVTVVEEKSSEKKGKSRKWVAIEQRVLEGRQYKVGDITVTGNTVFGNEELLRLVPLKTGEVLNEARLKAGLAFIDAKYGERGYFYISTNRLLNRHEDARADITIKINEDRQYYVDRIEFAGNLTTRDFVLRREMRLKEGELFDLNKFRLGLRRISQLGYFQLSGEPNINPVPGENRLQVRIEGTEPRRSELQVGGGYSGLDGGFFATSYQTRNFLGRGNIVAVNAQIGSISNRYQFTFTEPYLFGKPITAGFSAFRRDTQFIGFNTSGSGGSVSLGRRFRNFHNLSVALLHETTDFNPRAGLSSTTTINSVRPFYSYDTRNNFFRPTRGFQFFFSSEYAGGLLGGETSFIKPQMEIAYYFQVFKRSYIALHGEVGYVTALGGEELPTFERFFLGGERSLRNFGTRTVGPRGFICNFGVSEAVENIDDCPGPPPGLRQGRISRGFITDVVGGDRKALLNLEYVVPLSEPVDFIVYMDVGNAFAQWESLGFSDMRGDAGVELRFFVPVFGAPLRLIYGQTFNTRGTEDTKSFLFSIGTTF